MADENRFDRYFSGEPQTEEAPPIVTAPTAVPANRFDEYFSGAPQPITPLAAPAPERTWLDTAKDVGRTALDTARAAENTLTFGMADRLAGGRDYLVGKITGSGPQSYNEAVDRQVAGSAEARERSPYASVAGDVGGAVAIPGMFGAKLGVKLAPKVGGFLGRAIGYGSEGAAVGALQGAGNTYTGNLPDYVNNATMGGVLGLGTGAVLGGAFGARKAPGSSAKVPSTDEHFVAKTADYKNLANSGALYEPTHLAQSADTVEALLRSPQYRYQPARSPVTWQGIEEMRAPPTTAHLGRGAPVSPGDIEAIRQGLIQINPVTEQIDLASARHVKKALDDFVLNPPPGAVLPGTQQAAAEASALAQRARGNYGAYRRGQTWDDLVENASTGAGSVNSGLNLENKLRAGTASLVRLKDGQSAASKAGFNPDEIDALTKYARGKTGSNVLRWASNITAGGGGIGAPVVGYLAGGATGQYFKDNPEAYLAAPAVGLGLRMLANRRAHREVLELGDMIRRRSPLFQDRAATAPMNPIAQGTSRARNVIAQELLRQNLE